MTGKKFKINKTGPIVNVLYIYHGNFYFDIEEVHFAYISKRNSEKLGWQYFPVARLSALLKGITSTGNYDFYCLNCLHSFRKKNFNYIEKYAKTRFLWYCNTFKKI